MRGTAMYLAMILALVCTSAHGVESRSSSSLSIDPKLIELKKLVASDAAIDDQFGWAIAISGDTIVVGAPLDDDAGSASGSAHIFERDAGGADNWGQVQEIYASDPTPNDWFGWRVGISGRTVLVGVPQDDDVGSSSGAAYVFAPPSLKFFLGEVPS